MISLYATINLIFNLLMLIWNSDKFWHLRKGTWHDHKHFQGGEGPGIPVGEGANPPGGANIPFCQHFQKLHEIEHILPRG